MMPKQTSPPIFVTTTSPSGMGTLPVAGRAPSISGKVRDITLTPLAPGKRSLICVAGTPDDKKLSGWTLGALVFYEGGEYGHVAICAEDSSVIFTTDLPNKGKVGRVDVNAPVKDWGMTLLGYTVACVLGPLLSLMLPNYACLQIFPPCLSARSLARVLKRVFSLLWLKQGRCEMQSATWLSQINEY